MCIWEVDVIVVKVYKDQFDKNGVLYIEYVWVVFVGFVLFLEFICVVGFLYDVVEDIDEMLELLRVVGVIEVFLEIIDVVMKVFGLMKCEQIEWVIQGGYVVFLVKISDNVYNLFFDCLKYFDGFIRECLEVKYCGVWRLMWLYLCFFDIYEILRIVNLFFIFEFKEYKVGWIKGVQWMEE